MCLFPRFITTLLLALPLLLRAAAPAPAVERPWVQGIGLHVEPAGRWRVQVMLPAAFLPSVPSAQALPTELKGAPVPSVLLHFKHLRPGLQQLVDLSGGLPASLLPLPSHGPRAGFYLRQAQDWLKNGKAVLEPLAQREAWVLHYGELPSDGKRTRRGGTALFVPGKLPGRNRLALELARVNPLSIGVRSQKMDLDIPGKGPIKIEAIRGVGGVFYLAERSEGMWLFDRESLAKKVLAGGAKAANSPKATNAAKAVKAAKAANDANDASTTEADERATGNDSVEPTLGSRPRWMALALGGQRETTEASLWIIPRLAGSPGSEQAFSQVPKSSPATPPLLSGSPRGSDLTLALGGGPVGPILRALTEADDAYDLEAKPERHANRKAIQADLKRLLAMTRPESLNLSWHGWTRPADAGKDASKTNVGKTHGGNSDAGMSPSVAAALPLKAGKGADAAKLMRHLFPRLFEGKTETKKAGGVELVRIHTDHAFIPAWAVVKDVLVVGFSDEAVEAMVMGLAGQAPTLADAPPAGWGAAALDGERLSQSLEKLLVSYLGAYAAEYGLGKKITADEVAAETAATFGPFFGVLKRVGKLTLRLEWKPSGLELGPQ